MRTAEMSACASRSQRAKEAARVRAENAARQEAEAVERQRLRQVSCVIPGNLLNYS